MNYKNLLEKVLEEKPQKFKAGDKVRLTNNALQLHSRTIPAHAGYNYIKEITSWRTILAKYQENKEVGEVTHTQNNTSTVKFGKYSTLIYDYMLELAN